MRRPRLRLRFSIRGILILTLGIAVGLAWRQVPGASVPDALLSAFATWFAIGMFQEATRGWRVERDNDHAVANHGTLRVEAVAALALGIVIPSSLILTAINRNLLHSDETGDFLVLRAAEAFGDASVLLAICCGYWLTQGQRRVVYRPREAWERATTGLGILVGVFWLSWLVLNETLITSLVHVSIKGVENYQPIRRLGHVFQNWSPTDGLVGLFVRRAYLSAALFVAAIALVVSMCRNWERGRWVRAVLGAAAVVCIAADLALIGWCRSVLPRISPLQAELVGGQPLLSQLQALVLICIATSAAAWRLTAYPCPQETPDNRPPKDWENQSIHLRASVISLGVIVILWQYWDTVRLAALFAANLPLNLGERLFALANAVAGSLMQPLTILQLVLLIVLSSIVWRARRGKQDEGPVRWSVSATKFVAAWLILFCVALVTPAIAAWYGVALYLHLGMN